MSVGRKIEDEREAVRCLRAAERQGVSAGAWARAHGVDGRSMLRASPRAPAQPARSGLDGDEHAGTIKKARNGPTSPTHHLLTYGE